MTHRGILAIVQAGGAGSRMDVLTRERAKPALPFAGVFQLIDFPLSNLTHSGVADVWISMQYQAFSLEEEIANGRPWDLDRNVGGLRLLMPEQGTGTLDQEGFATGNADGLYRIRDRIGSFDPEVVIVLSADHVYRLDYRDVIRTHLDAGALCTLVTTEVPLADASDHATVEHDDDGRVTGFAYKPEKPTTGVVATEVVLYDPAALLEALDTLHRDLSQGSDAGDSGLGDFGEHLVPHFVEQGRAVVHPMPGYWRDVGQPHKYLAAHRELLASQCDVFEEPGWPVLTRRPQRHPAQFLAGAEVTDSLISPGCRVAGTVRSSVLGPGVVVEEGAEITDSVVFGDTVVRRDARVAWSIVDTHCEIGPEATLGDLELETAPDDSAQVTLVGRGSTVAAGARIDAGGRLEPGTTA